eukprot:TRINITY_DN7666_c0_g1_i1.p1 TRINITY_DN7666_c0_g1~~TRINITY_DN7666_c0_g1_i1.p1  ORF type:complete len:352 (-),score=42.67 TRINITY_DN7666_c0_g1_i1:134-1189(-)
MDESSEVELPNLPSNSLLNRTEIKASNNEAKEKRKELKKLIHNTLENPRTSKSATLYHIFQVAVVGVFVGFLLASSFPKFWTKEPNYFLTVEIICVVIFTLDYLARFFTSDCKLTWLRHPQNIIDLVTVLPFYVALFLLLDEHSKEVRFISVFRILQFIKIFQISRFGRYGYTFLLVLTGLKRSSSAFTLLGFLLLMLLTLSSSCMFYAEQTGMHFDNVTLQWIYVDNSTSPYQSVPDTFWWCFVTITTVGYGDAYPKTVAGKVVACFTMCFAFVLLALPITLISYNFNRVLDEYALKGEIDRLINDFPELDTNAILEKKIQDLNIEMNKLYRFLEDLNVGPNHLELRNGK